MASVGTRTERFVDPSRITDPTQGHPGDETPERRLPTTILYPADADGTVAAGEFPIVLFSHGLGGEPSDYEELLATWVTDGFVVVAPTFPLTNRSSGTQRAALDVAEQPEDASFVLTAVIELVSERGDELNGYVDTSRVIAAGHSLGGITTVGLFNGCCRDRRVDAGIVLAGNDLGFRREPYSQSATQSLFFVHGDRDDTVPIASGRKAYDKAPGPKAFVTLEGATHITPYLGASDPHFDAVAEVTSAFLRWATAGGDNAMNALRSATEQDGVQMTDELT